MDFPFWNINIPTSCSPLFEQPSWLIYLSLLSQTGERSPPLWSRLRLWCAHTHTEHTHTHEPLCSPWSFLFLSLFLIKPRPLLHFAYLFPDMCSLKKTSRPARSFLVQCALPSMTSSAVVLCHSAWGLSLKPKAALEEASDGFCPLFHSLAFIPLCSQQTSRQIPNKHVI